MACVSLDHRQQPLDYAPAQRNTLQGEERGMSHDGVVTEAECGEPPPLTPRTKLHAAAPAAGAAVGSGAVTGFPTIWAQNIKEVKLLHVGGSFSAIKEISAQATKDLGFTIETQAVDPPTQISRSLSQPKTIDINDLQATSLPYLSGKGVLAPIPVAKYKLWNKTVPMFTKGQFPEAGSPPRKVTRR
jgi:putative spermidine/putrescine transport system substrate-binding protein